MESRLKSLLEHLLEAPLKSPLEPPLESRLEVRWEARFELPQLTSWFLECVDPFRLDVRKIFRTGGTKRAELSGLKQGMVRE